MLRLVQACSSTFEPPVSDLAKPACPSGSLSPDRGWEGALSSRPGDLPFAEWFGWKAHSVKL